MIKITEQKMDRQDKAKHATHFKTSFDYVLNLLGLLVGFSNVWRFPYMCYKNGGGSFVVAYITLVVIFIYPLIIIECAIGQYTGYSAVKVWLGVPILRGLGYACPFIMFYFNIYYPVLLTWASRWFVSSFSPGMQWMYCNNEWNTGQCIPLLGDSGSRNLTEANTTLTGDHRQQQNFSTGKADVDQSSVEEFWNRHLLNKTDGIEHIDGIKPDLLACLATVWTLAYFSIWKGIQWTSKIVYVTATLPIVMLIVVLIRGVTLDGAIDGLQVYMRPNITKLGEFEVWTDAASQVLFSLAVCAGGITTLSQFNKFNHNFYRDSIILVVGNGMVSFLAGLATFSILGFLAHAKNTTIEEVADSGPGLVFIVYPTALSFLPLPNFWCALFFLMLILLGFDSLFVYVEAFMSCLKDQFPRYFQFKWSGEILTAVVIFTAFLLGLPMVTRGGMYVLNIYNSYAVTGWCVYFLAFWEMIAVGWIYDADEFLDNMKKMLGFNVTRLYYKACWKFIGPVIAAVLMVYSLAEYRPLKYGKSYVYPVWADLFGWMTALSSMLAVPVTAAYVLYKAEGLTFKKKFKNSFRRRGMSKRVAELEVISTELKSLKDDEEKI